MQTWQMQTAKARFSDVIRSAKNDGPQDITLHGKSVAVVLSRELFDRLSGNTQSLLQFMQSSPLHGLDDLELERDPSQRLYDV
jgi:prevent-host-death family protein